ncbi:MAG: HAMP domain-containing histidine kinase [Ruminococcus flavefaciens]|nr:HAMP domain-containing histidine kinase [Ruminococcus flavefaciens]MCM1230320.1 HAMP domain-containing histidine kinase [Ruminococcus flavefaciens]
MEVLLVIFGIILVIVLFLFILQKREIKSISQQLERILSRDSNELVHSENGGISKNLINSINSSLKKMRRNQILYNKKSHDLEQMITNISHDLRTPLTSAMGYIDIIISSDMPDDEKQKMICIIEQRLVRLEELINSFFEFSKVISGDRKPEISSVNLIEILQESVVHYYDYFVAQEREIIFNCDMPRILINSNRNMLMRIFDNLIGNAYKHDSGNLTISVFREDNIRICFENRLSDSCIDIDRIFDEFYTTDISRTKGNTGLGLAIARQFTEMLDGEISAKYERNIFSVTVKINK